MISGISTIFDWDSRDRGQNAGPFNQADMVDIYGQRLNEELDYENVRTHHIDTRRPPFRTEDERLADVPANFLPVILSCAWHPSARKTNSGIVEYAGESNYRLADDLCFVLAEWGRAYVYGHRILRPSLVAGERGFIRIKPFAINGPHAEEYMRRLDRLGEDLGRTIGEYLRGIGVGLRK